MIAAHENLSQFARALSHLVRTGAVAHDVAEVHHLVKWRSTSQGRIESLKIGVDVA